MAPKLTYEEFEKKISLITDYTYSWEYLIGPDSKLSYVSPSCKNHTGYTQQEFMVNEELFSNIIHPEDKELVSRHIHHKKNVPLVESLEFRIVDRGGRTRWISHTCRPVYDENGDFLGRRASNWDITDQKQAEKERDESNRKLQETSSFLNTVLDAIPDVIGVQDLKHKIICYNRAGYAFFNMEPPEVHGKKCYELIGNKVPCHVCPLSDVYKNEKPAQVEKYVKELNKWLDVRAYPVFDETGDLTGIIEHIRDISKEKETEIQLKKAHDSLITVLNSIDVHIYVVDINSYEILFMNKKMIEDFNADFVGEKCYESFQREKSPCSICTNHQFLDENKELTGVHTWQCRNPITNQWYINFGRTINWIDGRSARVQIAMDITEAKNNEEERKQMEQQLLQAQKLEAIGTVSGGIAHDFNNLLMGIQGRASLMEIDLESNHPCREHVEVIMECSRNATELTSQLLGVARVGKYETKPISINDVVMSSSTMFGRTKKEISIHTKLHDPPPVVVADRRHIEQVFLNIYINAWQAMHRGGELYLETTVVTLDEKFCKPYSIDPNRYVRISATDTGTGMDKETLKRVFDPFFTTKKRGRGTGLGLASAYGIVKNHLGTITVYSEIGKGTTFNVYLPVSDQKVKEEPTLDQKLIVGSETILLVDDESIVINVCKEMIEKLGYDVITAKSGKLAVDMFREKSEDIDLIILDMIMPGMDGDQTFDQLREINSSIPILLSSGYSLNSQAKKIMEKGCNGFIQKPFLITQLSEKIQNILDEN